MKSLITLFLLVGLFHVSMAWGQCATGIESAGNPECLPPDDSNSPYYQGSANQPQIQEIPPVRWENRWGAIVTDNAAGVGGTAANHTSKSEAIATAMSDCTKRGGTQCTLDLAYYNQCAAVAWGDAYRSTSGGPTKENAESHAMDKCSQNAKNCKVVYSACSMAVRVQ